MPIVLGFQTSSTGSSQYNRDWVYLSVNSTWSYHSSYANGQRTMKKVDIYAIDVKWGYAPNTLAFVTITLENMWFKVRSAIIKLQTSWPSHCSRLIGQALQNIDWYAAQSWGNLTTKKGKNIVCSCTSLFHSFPSHSMRGSVQ